ncbi:uncharacterized protein LOC118648135 isoform X2 [Monomorium pharaonis]|nr:uncharacterized protein LOC118645010 isoform X3 [Monomorium pharaonis]XP_036142266.1 uncharacterized protein LOC118645410 [Monomorium pharaonis]XP_036150540.1 uncharacterized protein LOC118648135 isoform X2 [Monomorium pharaonis]
MEKNERKEKKKISARSGRLLIRPKKLWTTSSDEGPPRKKRSKGQITVRKEFEKLRQSGKDMADTNDELRQPHEFSDKLSTLNKSDDMIAKATNKNSKKKNCNDNYSAAVYNEPLKLSENGIKKFYADSVSKTSVSEMENVTHVQTERNQPCVDHSGPAKFLDYTTKKYNAASVLATPASTTVPDDVRHSTPVQEERNDEPRVADSDSFIVNTAPSIDTELKRKLAVLEELSRNLIKGQTDIQQQLKEIKEKPSDEYIVSRSLYQLLDGYPLNTLEQFNEIEHESKKLERQKLYRHFIGLGAVKIRDFIYTAIKQTMTDELVNKFTWLGDEHNTKELGNTKMMNIIYYAAKKCSHFEGPVDKEAFKIEMLQVLRTIKQRFRRTIKKRNMDEVDENDEDDNDEHQNTNTDEESDDYSQTSKSEYD